jgi:hypothetical protein
MHSLKKRKLSAYSLTVCKRRNGNEFCSEGYRLENMKPNVVNA